MKKRLILFLVCGLIMLLLIGCGRGQKETDEYIVDYNVSGLQKDFLLSAGEAYMKRFEELGLFGEHLLERFKVTDNDFTRKLKGSFFLGFGRINDEIYSFESLKFAWRFNSGNIIISSLPLEDIIIIVDESKKVPTIQLKFFIDDDIPDLVFVIAKDNPNILINSKYICYAKIRINSNDLQNEIFLPNY